MGYVSFREGKNGDDSHGIRNKIINKANPNKQTGSSSGIKSHPINKHRVYPGKQASGKKKHQQKKHMEFLEPSKNQSFICMYIYKYIYICIINMYIYMYNIYMYIYILYLPGKRKKLVYSLPLSLSLLLQNPEKNMLGFQAGRQGVATFHGT